MSNYCFAIILHALTMMGHLATGLGRLFVNYCDSSVVDLRNRNGFVFDFPSTRRCHESVTRSMCCNNFLKYRDTFVLILQLFPNDSACRLMTWRQASLVYGSRKCACIITFFTNEDAQADHFFISNLLGFRIGL